MIFKNIYFGDQTGAFHGCEAYEPSIVGLAEPGDVTLEIWHLRMMRNLRMIHDFESNHSNSSQEGTHGGYKDCLWVSHCHWFLYTIYHTQSTQSTSTTNHRISIKMNLIHLAFWFGMAMAAHKGAGCVAGDQCQCLFADGSHCCVFGYVSTMSSRMNERPGSDN